MGGQGVLPNLVLTDFTRLADHQAPGILLSPNVVITGLCPLAWLFNIGSGDQTQVFMKSSLTLTQLSLYSWERHFAVTMIKNLSISPKALSRSSLNVESSVIKYTETKNYHASWWIVSVSLWNVPFVLLAGLWLCSLHQRGFSVLIFITISILCFHWSLYFKDL